ncbi:MAG: putative sugar transporter, permease protein [Anaerocolumna sp.]|jgi:arabinogalactan oligomer/maltooligosaccharide transport system permease protein|nr:putative sugar transporter, permease protein [Anaerocolumna sp.]
MKKKTKKIIGLSFLNLFFMGICFIGLIPIIYALFLSLSKSNMVLSGNSSLLPSSITLRNYRDILIDKPFFTWLFNSVKLSLYTMILAMSCAVIAAYAFSRYHFSGKWATLKLLLLLNAFPQILSMFAIFRLFKEMKLLNTEIGLVLVYAGSMCIFGIWNLKGYFDTIPLEIEEASRIDGANDFQLIRKIVLPLAMPSIIVTSVMVLIFVWNEYLFSTTFLLSESNYTLAGGLYQLQANDYSRSWPMFSAASILISLPILVMFFFIQKNMVSGLTSGGVKG